ncbi:MAG: hypothetical protein F6J90_09215 [Moorea sp. SIOASIH]|nr:hypothetical protein [Moorena sp. SIOASIH]
MRNAQTGEFNSSRLMKIGVSIQQSAVSGQWSVVSAQRLAVSGQFILFKSCSV